MSNAEKQDMHACVIMEIMSVRVTLHRDHRGALESCRLMHVGFALAKLVPRHLFDLI